MRKVEESGILSESVFVRAAKILEHSRKPLKIGYFLWRHKKVSTRLPGPVLPLNFAKIKKRNPMNFLTLELNLSRENLCECYSIC